MSMRVQQAIKPESRYAGPVPTGLPEHIRLRRLQAGDSLEKLTRMLHHAFFQLWKMGIPCACVTQTLEVTRQRVAHGDCFVAVSGEQILGTVTLYAPEAASESEHFRDARVASLRQLAVAPRFQGKGVGTALLRLAERWARKHGYDQLALDTPKPAAHLFDYYQRHGFHVVETLQFSSRPYRSLIFAKSLHRPANIDHRPLSPRGGGCKLAAVSPPSRRIQPAQQAIAPKPPRKR